MKKQSKHTTVGKWGESCAKQYLLQKGFRFLHQNWRYKKLEVDLIFENDDLLLFVEVKARSTNFFGSPESAVDLPKQKKLAKAAAAYIEEFEIEKEIRFDIVAITGNTKQYSTRHIEEAFFPFETY